MTTDSTLTLSSRPTPAPTPLEPGALKISTRVSKNTSQSYIIEAHGERYLLWVTKTDTPEQAASLETREWEEIGNKLKPFLTGKEKDKVTVELGDKDTVKMNGSELPSEDKTKPDRELLATTLKTLRTAQYKLYVSPFAKPEPKKETRSAEKPGKKDESDSSIDPLPGEKLTPEQANLKDTAMEIGNVDKPIDTTALIVGLRFLSNSTQDAIDILPAREASGYRPVAWEIATSDKAGAEITKDQLLIHCNLPEKIEKPIYIPIRITGSSHFVGILVDTKRNLHFYDSTATALPDSAANKAIRDFADKHKLNPSSIYVVGSDKTPHQTDGIHCGIYQMRWYMHIYGLNKAGTELCEKTLFKYETDAQAMVQFRKNLKEDLIKFIRFLISEKPDPTQRAQNSAVVAVVPPAAASTPTVTPSTNPSLLTITPPQTASVELLPAVKEVPSDVEDNVDRSNKSDKLP